MSGMISLGFIPDADQLPVVRAVEDAFGRANRERMYIRARTDSVSSGSFTDMRHFVKPG